MHRKLTKELYLEFQKLHNELWTWLVYNSKKTKYEWPKWKEIFCNYGKITNYSFSCEIWAMFKEDNLFLFPCQCPIIWSDNVIHNKCGYNSLYYKWKNTSDMNYKSFLANRISNLEWKSYEEYIKL